MGLFGYGKADFDKSTAEFKGKLLAIMQEANVSTESGRVINQTLVNLDNFAMPDGANKKAVQSFT